MSSETMMVFPSKLNISLKDGEEALKLKDVMLYIHLIANYKNDYHLGPYFSNENGEWEISKGWMTISAEAEIQTGLMDYRHYNECKPQVKIVVQSGDKKEQVLSGRNIWGVIQDEDKLYGSKENLLKQIEQSNNHLIEPKEMQVNFDNSNDEIKVEIHTRKV